MAHRGGGDPVTPAEERAEGAAADREVAAYERCASLCESHALAAREQQARASAKGRAADVEAWRRVARSADAMAESIRSLAEDAGARRDAILGGGLAGKVTR